MKNVTFDNGWMEGCAKCGARDDLDCRMWF